MNNNTQTTDHDAGSIVDDARSLISATADATNEKVCAARKRLVAALDRAKEIAGQVRDKTVAGAKVADEAVHEHPYQAIAIGVGVGALIGYLVARRFSRDRD